jgi:uncharacterized cupredoxin-like copper-binding protein
MKKLSLLLLAACLAVAAPTFAAGRAGGVKATEVEFHLKLSSSSAPHGKVTFVVQNKGKLAHQFLVLRTKLAAGKLPVKGTTVVVSKAGKLVGGIAGAGLKPGATKSVTVTLAAGHYVLFCNIPAHYKAGQFVSFTVK